MRYFCAASIALAIFLPSATLAQGSFSIVNYQLVSQERATQTQDFLVYRADLTSSGQPYGTVTASVSSVDPFSVRTLPGNSTLTFVRVPATGQTTSTNTFKILVDRSIPVNFANLVWTFQTTPQGPIANPGPNQLLSVGSTAILNGSGSSNPNGTGVLNYSWTWVSRPPGTSTRLQNSATSIASFVVDVAGDYTVMLTVSNGDQSDSANVTVSTTSTPPPVANAGPDRSASVGDNVVLNGGLSTSGSGKPLTYAWTITSRPSGSTASLSGANTMSPSFTVDKGGSYQIQLIVYDNGVASAPSVVTVSTQSAVKPVANAGPDQAVDLGTTVQLDGSASTDANKLPLTYLWSVISLPQGSSASLSNSTAVTPTFKADKAGIYVAQLIVNNGKLNSDPSTVTITIRPGTAAPVANAGPNQNVQLNSTVQLTGSGSDPQNLPLTYKWSLINKPNSSNAALSNSAISNPTFVADQPGSYVAQLVVNNGTLNSAPSTVTISTACAPPTANAGQDRNVTTGATVNLDGGASGDACRSTLTYAWSFTTRPNGSAATLLGANTATPAFVADVAGLYVAQLIVNNGATSSAPATVKITAADGNPGPGITISLAPASLSVCAAASQTLTINLSAPAPSSGVTINLSSDNTAVATVQTPAVFIPAKASSGTVTIMGVGAGSANIHASSLPSIADVSAPVTITSCTGIVLPPNMTLGIGDIVDFPVSLSSPAPSGGVFISLTSSDSSKVAISPSAILVNEGRTSPSRAPTVTANGFGSVTITASAFGFPTTTRTVVVSAGVLSFAPTTLTIAGPATQNLTLNVSSAQPTSSTINLSSSDATVASVPATVTIGAGATSVQVPVTGLKQGTAIIHASSAVFADTTASVTVNVPGQIVLPSNVTVGVGQSVPFPVTLSSAAPAGGITITLTTDAPKVTIAPTSLFIAAGATAPGTQPQITGVSPGSATIGASAPGSSPVSQNVQVTGALSFAGGLSLAPGTSGNLTLNLSGSAPAGGFTATLVSSNPGVASVGPSAFIPAGSNTVQVPVNGGSIGAATITASGSNVTSAIANVGVNVNTGTIVLTNVPLVLGQSVPFPVSLSSPAVSPVTITLASGDTAKVTVPATVVIPAGSTTPAVQPQITATGAGFTSVSASAPGFAPVIQPVLVTAAMSFSGPVTVPAGGTANLNLNLTSGQAPASGLTITLNSANASVATVPPSVTIAAGGTNAIIPVTGLSQGTTTITASALNIANATANVTVGSAASIVLPGSTSVGLGKSVPFAVSLSQAAPADVTINLGTGDASKVTISPSSVLIPQGSTTPGSQPQVAGVGAGSANITASATGFGQVSQSVQVVAPTISFAPPTLTIAANGNGSLNLTLSSPAPPAGFTINLSSINTGVATVPSTVNFAANATSVSVPVTAVGPGSTTIHASALPSIADTTANVQVTSGPVISLPSNVSVGLGQSVPFAVTLSAPAQSDVTVNLSSSDGSKVTISPGSVLVPAGQTTPQQQPQVTGINGGSATISASASGYTSASQTVQVTTPTASFSPLSLPVNTGGTGILTLTLSTPAPPGGLTLNLSSSNGAVASVPGTVSFAGNATTASVQVTGVSAGTAVIHASAPPNIPDTTANVTVSAPATIVLQNNITVPVGLSAAFPVTLSAAAAGPVTINLSSSDGSKVTISPTSVQIAQGATTPANQPQVTGVGAGSATINATGNGFASASANVQAVTTNLTFSPGSAILNLLAPPVTTPPTPPTPVTQNLTLSLSAPAPAGGATINLSSSNSAVASVPATVKFAPGAAATTVGVTGLAAGTATITASGPNLSATAGITVNQLCGNCIGVGNATVGQNLQGLLTITLPQAAPAAVTVTITSGDPSKLLISGRVNAQGQGSVSILVPQGATTVNPYIQALDNSGAVNVTASASGFTDGNGTVTLAPSSFILAGPSGIGKPFVTGQGAVTNITAQAALLDAYGNVIQVQQVRGGFPVNVAVNLSPSDIGTLAPPSAAFNGGDDSVAMKFTPVNSGVATLTAVIPPGFNTPSQGANSLTATVSSAALLPGNVTVGRNLETTAKVALTGPTPQILQITLTSNDPGRLLLSNTKDAAGSPSITINLPAGFATTPDFYLYGLAGSGTATYTATAPGFASGTGTVTLAPSGIVIAGPGGVGSGSFLTTTQFGSTAINVSSALLDSGNNFVALQAVAGGTNVNVNVNSSNQSFGVMNPSTVTIQGGSDTATSFFQPVSPGTTTLSVNVPPGFSPPNQDTSVQANVVTQSIGIADKVTVGNHLQYSGVLILPGGSSTVTVTLTSNNPNLLLLSSTAGGAGSASITVTIPAGTSVGSYYLQGQASSGTATYTASVPGYSSRTGTVTLAPSAVIIQGPFGLDTFRKKPYDFTASASRGATTLTLSVGIFDPSSGNFVSNQALAGGQSLSITLTNTNDVSLTVPSPVTIPGGTDTVDVRVLPWTPGTTTVSINTPPGFTQNTYSSIRGTITQ